MTYKDDPEKLAKLLRDLAAALKDAGVNPSGTSPARNLIDDAEAAARELAPRGTKGPGRLHGFS
jgi:sugar phosphate isomerase/epimerase